MRHPRCTDLRVKSLRGLSGLTCISITIQVLSSLIDSFTRVFTMLTKFMVLYELQSHIMHFNMDSTVSHLLYMCARQFTPIFPVFENTTHKSFIFSLQMVVISHIFTAPNLLTKHFAIFICSMCEQDYKLTYEPRREKTGLRGFRPGPTQTGLRNHRRKVDV